MKGFLKRDCCLILPNLRFYLVFLAIICAASLFADGVVSMLALYLTIFGLSGVLGVFSYDEANGWGAYAAAVPNGRRAMVDARYLFATSLALLLTLATVLVSLVGSGGLGLWSVGFYGGSILLSLSVLMPLTYYFGGIKARVITLVVVMGIAGGISAGIISGGQADLAMGRLRGDVRSFFTALSLGLLLLGLGLMAASWRISRRIMAKREL